MIVLVTVAAYNSTYKKLAGQCLNLRQAGSDQVIETEGSQVDCATEELVSRPFPKINRSGQVDCATKEYISKPFLKSNRSRQVECATEERVSRPFPKIDGSGQVECATKERVSRPSRDSKTMIKRLRFLFRSRFSSFYFPQDQAQFPAHLPSHRCIFLRTPDEVRHHFPHRSIRQIFRHIIASIAQIETDMVAHPVKLCEKYARIFVAYF